MYRVSSSIGRGFSRLRRNVLAHSSTEENSHDTAGGCWDGISSDCTETGQRREEDILTIHLEMQF